VSGCYGSHLFEKKRFGLAPRSQVQVQHSTSWHNLVCLSSLMSQIGLLRRRFWGPNMKYHEIQNNPSHNGKLNEADIELIFCMA